jgi:hypothetical protein
MSLSQHLLPFKIELLNEPEAVTAHAGLPLVLEAMRAAIPAARYRELRDALGYENWKVARRHVESLILLVCAGGEHLSDLAVLRGDAGLEKLVGFRMSSPSQAKDFLYRFHQHADGRPLAREDDLGLSVVGTATIRDEGPGLRALEACMLDLVAALQSARPRTTATLDVDATIIEAHKELALLAYEGTRGYQPQMAWWAELGVWVCDEFRDGNVPAAYQTRAFLQRAFGNLPETVERLRLRADSALYDEAALTWADDAGIEFAVSADMTEELAARVAAVHDYEWRPYKSHSPRASVNEERQWAEVRDFIPNWKRNFKAGTEPLRYVAIRVRPRQQPLFGDEDDGWRHYAVVTNMGWRGDRLLNWHREKQGTVEQAHGVMKNDLGGGVLPCGKFGSNAAWWRLNALAHNVLVLLKDQALPRSTAWLRPKALRFQLLALPGRVVRHARSWTLKLYGGFPLAQAYVSARATLAALHRMLRAPPALAG